MIQSQGVPCVDDFAEKCGAVVLDMNPRDLVAANSLIATVSKIAKKHPFVFLPDFMEDFVGGESTGDMMSRYHIPSSVDFANLSAGVLKMKGRRSQKGVGSRGKNMGNRKWREQYDLVSLQSAVLYDLLVDLHCCSALTAMLTHAVLRDHYIAGDYLEAAVLKSYEEMGRDIHVPRASRNADPVGGYVRSGLGHKIEAAASRLASAGSLTYMNGGVSAPEKYSRIEDVVYKILDNKKDGASYQALMSASLQELPLLRQVPSMGALDACLAKMEKDGRVVYKGSSRKYSAYGQQLFTSGKYDRLVEKVRREAGATRTKFFGRRTTPDRFIDELCRLDPGDLDDLDDQVTRIAGLVMSGSVLPQSPRDPTGVFDFVVDVSGYTFRPEQEDLMREIDFEANSAVFHCKVLVSEAPTLSTLSALRSAVPRGEQGVVFTCRSVPSAVAASCREDRTVQVVDERGIRKWCAITRIMPCRKGSVALVMYGDDEGRAAMVRSLNYESGMATVELAPDRAEATLPIACLKEVGPDDPEAGDEFDEVSASFFDLVRSLAEIAPGTFEDGVRECAAQVYKTRGELPEDARAAALRRIDHAARGGMHEPTYIRYVAFDGGVYAAVASRVAHTLECTCLHSINDAYRTTLCRHLVAAVAAVASRDAYPAVTIGHLKKSVILLREGNVERAASALGDILGDKHRKILKEYLLARADAS